MSKRTLILGIDGGGSKTAVRIAVVESKGELRLIGQGNGGPSNARAVGEAHAEINLNVAVDAAHHEAGTAKNTIDYAVLGLAGSSLPDVKSFIEHWARRRELAATVDVVHDADPVLAVAAPDGYGIALIVGTGSSAIGLASDGRRRVTGGWGHWFGDTGSGYDLGRRALAAVADAVDGVGPETLLTERILGRLHTDNPREIVLQLGRSTDVSREIASMAPVLLAAAEEGDTVANAIVTAAATGATKLVLATIEKLGLARDVPLAIAGGIVCSNTMYRETLLAKLGEQGVHPASVTVVSEPVEGCLLMARDRLRAARTSS
jgi:N-acetylglucosamine kinase-like BadF-type ATPase